MCNLYYFITDGFTSFKADQYVIIQMKATYQQFQCCTVYDVVHGWSCLKPVDDDDETLVCDHSNESY